MRFSYPLHFMVGCQSFPTPSHLPINNVRPVYLFQQVWQGVTGGAKVLKYISALEQSEFKLPTSQLRVQQTDRQAIRHFCVIPSDNEVLVSAIVTVAKPAYDVFPGVKRKLYCILFLLFSRDLGIQERLRNKGRCGRYDLEPVRRSDYGSSWTQRSRKNDHNVHSNRYIALRRFVSSSNCLLLSPVPSLTRI